MRHSIKTGRHDRCRIERGSRAVKPLRPVDGSGEAPEPRFEAMIATLFGLANAGRTNAKGMPGPLQLALIGREFADAIRFTRPPAAVQAVAFRVLGAVGRARGLRGIYPEYLAPHGKVTPDARIVELALGGNRP